MKKLKRLSIILVLLSAVVLLGITALATSTKGIICSATMDKTAVCEGDETVTLTLTFDQTEIKAISIQFLVDLPDGWTIASVENDNLTFDELATDPATGLPLVTWFDAQMEGVAIDTVAKIAVKVPVGTSEGEYTVAIRGIEILDDSIFEGSFDNIVGGSRAASASVTVGHSLVYHEAKAPTATEIGWDAYESCTRCDYTTYVEKAPTGGVWGDINGDGKFNSSDIAMLILIYENDPDAIAHAKGDPDVNDDGKFNTSDIAIVIEHYENRGA